MLHPPTATDVYNAAIALDKIIHAQNKTSALSSDQKGFSLEYEIAKKHFDEIYAVFLKAQDHNGIYPQE